jgi:signal transduction histidine kinase
MRINRHDRDVLIDLLKSNEDRLIEFILGYAKDQGYARYTSTLKEAWRLSIEGLSQAMIEVAERSDLVPQMGPDEDYSSDPATQFGVIEAQRHRARGVNLSMFLGLMKYYRQSYLDLLAECEDFKHPETINTMIRRVFDRTELAYCDEWAGTESEAQIQVLSRNNLRLASEKNKYLTLFESLSSPVILCDEEGKVDNYNFAAGRLLLDSDTPGSRYYAEQRNDLEPPGLSHELRRMYNKDLDRLELERQYETPEGKRTYAVRIKRMLDVSHMFAGYTIIFNDITDAIEWGEKLAKNNREQKHLIEDLNSARQQLVQSEKMAAIGQLASGVAHEINTPIQYVGENIKFIEEACDDLMTSAKMYQKLLAAAEEDKVAPELLAAARAQADDAELDYLFEEIPVTLTQTRDGVQQVADIVSGMKNFAKPGTEEKVHTDLNEAIMSTLSVSANEWKSSAEIETDLEPNLPYVPVVPGEINQAFLNIIVNAASAVKERRERDPSSGMGKIKILTREDGDWVVIEISDNGVGIPEEIQSKIFDPFFTTREVGEGSGQGLTVAYLAVVKMHAGMISVQSEPGGGTTLTVMLPITPGVNESAEQELWRLNRRGLAEVS